MDTAFDKLRAPLRRTLARTMPRIGPAKIIDRPEVREFHVPTKGDPKKLRRVGSARAPETTECGHNEHWSTS